MSCCSLQIDVNFVLRINLLAFFHNVLQGFQSFFLIAIDMLNRIQATQEHIIRGLDSDGILHSEENVRLIRDFVIKCIAHQVFRDWRRSMPRLEPLLINLLRFRQTSILFPLFRYLFDFFLLLVPLQRAWIPNIFYFSCMIYNIVQALIKGVLHI